MQRSCEPFIMRLSIFTRNNDLNVHKQKWKSFFHSRERKGVVGSPSAWGIGFWGQGIKNSFTGRRHLELREESQLREDKRKSVLNLDVLQSYLNGKEAELCLWGNLQHGWAKTTSIFLKGVSCLLYLWAFGIDITIILRSFQHSNLLLPPTDSK